LNKIALLKNASALSFSRVITILSSMVFGIFMARYLGPGGLGQYAFIGSVLGYFIIFSNFGTLEILTREIARNKENTNRFLLTSIIIKIGNVIISLLIISIIGFIFKQAVSIPLFIAGITLFPKCVFDSFYAVFLGHEKLKYIALSEIIHSIIQSFGGIFVLYVTHGSLVFLFIYVLFVDLLKTGIIIYFYSNRICKLKIYIPKSNEIKWLFNISKDMAVWKYSSALYESLNIIILSFTLGDYVTGEYKVAWNIISIFVTFITIFVTVTLPELSKLYVENKERFIEVIKKFLDMVFISFFPIFILVILFGNIIIITLYGEQYLNSVNYLKILFSGVSFSLILRILGISFIIINSQRSAMYLTLIMTLLKLCTLIILGSYLNINYFCLSIVLIEVFSCILHIHFINKKIKLFNWLKDGNLVFMLFYSSLASMIFFSNQLIFIALSSIIYLIMLSYYVRRMKINIKDVYSIIKRNILK